MKKLQCVITVLISTIVLLGSSGCHLPFEPYRYEFQIEVVNKIIDSPYDVWVVVDGPGNIVPLTGDQPLKPGQWLSAPVEFDLIDGRKTTVNVDVKFTVVQTGETYIAHVTLDLKETKTVTIVDKNLSIFDSEKIFSCKVSNGFWRINHRQRITAAGTPGLEYTLGVYAVGDEPTPKQLLFNIRRRGDRQVPVTFTFTDIDTLPNKSISKIFSLSLDQVVVVRATEQDFGYR